ncbi:MAG: enoyl-CoA hydratase-related protein [Pseudomonadota bacterium]
MTDATVVLKVDREIACVTLARPQRMNAFNARMHSDLRGAFDQIEARSDVAVVILTGAGRGFCAGQDLAERAAAFAAGEPPDLAASLAENYNPLVRRIATLPMPVIAAVNGVAAGAGAALAIGCDLVLAARSARFQFSFAKVALGPDSGTSWLLSHLVGQARALGLALTAEPVTAEEAARIGLIWRMVEDDALVAEAQALAERLAGGPRSAHAAIKRGVRDAACLTFDAALDAERDAQGRLGALPDYATAVATFVSGRNGQSREGVGQTSSPPPAESHL